MPQSKWWGTCADCRQVRSCMPRFWPHQKVYRVVLFGKQQHLSNLPLPCRWTWRAGRRWESPSVWMPTQGRWKRSCRSFWIGRCSFLLLARSSTRCLGCCLRSLNFASTFDLVIIIELEIIWFLFNKWRMMDYSGCLKERKILIFEWQPCSQHLFPKK